MNIEVIKREAPEGAEYVAFFTSGEFAYFKDNKAGYSGSLMVYKQGEWVKALSKIEDLNPSNYDMVIAL